jgi:hypothetical protein
MRTFELFVDLEGLRLSKLVELGPTLEQAGLINAVQHQMLVKLAQGVINGDEYRRHQYSGYQACLEERTRLCPGKELDRTARELLLLMRDPHAVGRILKARPDAGEPRNKRLRWRLVLVTRGELKPEAL